MSNMQKNSVGFLFPALLVFFLLLDQLGELQRLAEVAFYL